MDIVIIIIHHHHPPLSFPRAFHHHRCRHPHPHHAGFHSVLTSLQRLLRTASVESDGGTTRCPWRVIRLAQSVPACRWRGNEPRTANYPPANRSDRSADSLGGHLPCRCRR